MRIENCKPGIEVVSKDSGVHYIIRDAAITWTVMQEPEISVMEVEDNTFWLTKYPSELRLAKKPKRKQLLARIKELEAQTVDNVAIGLTMGGVKLREENAALVKRVEELESQLRKSIETIGRFVDKASINKTELIEDLEQQITSILNGTYFLTRPQREKWQMVARLTGLWVTCGGYDNGITLWSSKPYLASGIWQGHGNTRFYHLDGEWTDEPLENRIVGPVQTGEADTLDRNLQEPPR